MGTQSMGASQMGSGTSQMGMGQMHTGQTGQMHQGRLSPQKRSALMSVAEAIEVCSWCAEQCIQESNPDMIECIRLCEDVAELGETVLALSSRNSRYAESVAQSLEQAIQACGRECGRHQANHCQECARVLGQTATQMRSLTQSTAQMATR